MTTYTHKSNNVSDIFGHIEGVHVGKLFKNREECKDLGVHPVTGAGIYGSPSKGAYSVVLSGGYADDVDMGDIILYTGMGGGKRDEYGKKIPNGRQGEHQSFAYSFNKSLFESSKSKEKPVRVIRGANANSKYAPASGFRYDGLYDVIKAEIVASKVSKFNVCQFTLQRRPGQPPIPEQEVHQSPSTNKTAGRRRSPTAKELANFAKDERKFPSSIPPGDNVGSPQGSPLHTMLALEKGLPNIPSSSATLDPLQELQQGGLSPSGRSLPLSPEIGSPTPPIAFTYPHARATSSQSSSYDPVERATPPNPTWQEGGWISGRILQPEDNEEKVSEPETSRELPPGMTWDNSW